MGLDIRLPIGLLFSVLGLMLTAFGAVGDKKIYDRSMGVDVNLAWGAVLLTFGIIMGILGSHRTAVQRRSRTLSDSTAETADGRRDP